MDGQTAFSLSFMSSALRRAAVGVPAALRRAAASARARRQLPWAAAGAHAPSRVFQLAPATGWLGVPGSAFFGADLARSRPMSASAPAPQHSAECSTTAQPVGVKTTQEKLDEIRSLMMEHDLEAYIVPSEDAHQSEYVANCDARREYISGFTGSAGTVLITRDRALLWTDGRYFLQAEQELDLSRWTLMRAGLADTPTLTDWLGDNLSDGGRVGVDPTVLSIAMAKQLQTKLAGRNQELVGVQQNLVDRVWGPERPPAPFSRAIAHPEKFAGLSAADKVAAVRERLGEQGCYGVVVPTLDEIAWLLNVRGFDVSFNPVTIAYCLVTLDSVFLYVDEAKAADVAPAWGDLVTLRPYSAVFGDLHTFTAIARRFWMDPNKCSLALYDCLPPGLVHEAPSPVSLPKACKNEAELAGMRAAHVRDGVALCRFFRWLEAAVAGGEAVAETALAERLDEFRAASELFVCPSFPTIAGEGPNGAIIHYRAEEGRCGHVGPASMLLLDSGGQYRDGTTDVTRTVHFGEPTEHQRASFTRVLQGHIGLASAVFPSGVTGQTLDVLARAALWRDGLDYRHGTGHGVGAFLNVHEGPQSISQKPIDVPLRPGMVLSNEPGYYEDGAFGIRIENLMVVRETRTPHNFGGQGYLSFEYLTLVPIQRKLIDVTLLSGAERAWIDAYHADVRARLAPFLQDDPDVLAWLQDATQPL